MTQRITPHIWCDHDAEEAGSFYAAVFERTTATVVARYPTSGLPEFQRSFAGQALTVDVVIDGYRITLINAGDEFVPTPAISFLLNVDSRRYDGDAEAARAWLNRTWTRLAEDGLVLMDIGEYAFSGLYGWVEDRYGVSWQLKLTDPDADPIAPVVPMLTFSGALNGQEAIETYTSLLPDSEIAPTREYTATDPALEGAAVRYRTFRLAGQTFAAMDSPWMDDFAFTPGLSLQLDCDGQEEIDRIWSALSAVPAAEQCGWLVDRYGVSWQVVPANLRELMQRPHAYEHLMRMKRIVIAEL